MPVNENKVDATIAGTTPKSDRPSPNSPTSATVQGESRKSNRHKTQSTKASKAKATGATKTGSIAIRNVEGAKAALSKALTDRQEALHDVSDTLAYIADPNIFMAEAWEMAVEKLESAGEAEVEFESPFASFTLAVPSFESKYLPAAT